MAKVTVYIPEPKEQYDVTNQRQITSSLETLKNQLNFAFQEEQSLIGSLMFLTMK